VSVKSIKAKIYLPLAKQQRTHPSKMAHHFLMSDVSFYPKRMSKALLKGQTDKEF
jgi:hypothetical protein